MTDRSSISEIGRVKSMQLTGELRFLHDPKRTTVGPIYRLQREWICRETGEREWQDVPQRLMQRRSPELHAGSLKAVHFVFDARASRLPFHGYANGKRAKRKTKR